MVEIILLKQIGETLHKKKLSVPERRVNRTIKLWQKNGWVLESELKEQKNIQTKNAALEAEIKELKAKLAEKEAKKEAEKEPKKKKNDPETPETPNTPNA